MKQLPNYVLGAWMQPSGPEFTQHNAYTGEIISVAGEVTDPARCSNTGAKRVALPCAV